MNTPEKPIGERLADALEQLNQSERGRFAAVQLRKLLTAQDSYVLGLDQNNWQALETLVHGCKLGAACQIRDLLPKR